MGRRLGQHFLVHEETLRLITQVLPASFDVLIEIGPGHGELTNHVASKYLNVEENLFFYEQKLNVAQKNLESRIKNQGLYGIPRSGMIYRDNFSESEDHSNVSSRVEIRSIPRFVLIERDTRFIERLRAQFPNFEVIEGDALEVLPALLSSLQKDGLRYVVVGNIPYYITGQLFRILGDLEHKPFFSLFTIQKEVARRITTRPPSMNLLAFCVQYWCSPSIIKVLPRRFFQPAPKVDSAIISLSLIHHDTALQNLYYELVRILFKHPRKTVLNNIRSFTRSLLFPFLTSERITHHLESIHSSLRDRPQNLSVQEVVQLARNIQKEVK